MVKTLCLIGNGVIARLISDFVAARTDRFRIAYALNLEPTRSVGDHPVTTDLSTLEDANPDLVIEAASQEAVAAHAPKLLAAGLDVMLLSSGALAEETTEHAVRSAATKGGRALVPAGALPGIDGLAAARTAGLDRVTLTSAKPAVAWRGTPAEEMIDLAALRDANVFFEGTAREAAQTFPKNANVAATAALAGVGFEATRVKLIADPHGQKNTHHLQAEGTFGSMDVSIANNPAPDNPKTSHMAALSVLRAIENLDQAIVL